MGLTIYEAISLIISLVAIWISIKTYRLTIHPSTLARKQLSNIIQEETLSKLTVDLKHSPGDEYQNFIIENISKIEAYNVNISFNPTINFNKYDKEKFDKKIPYKVLYPRKKIFIEYQYHIYGKRDHFEVNLEWTNPDGSIHSQIFHI